VARLAHDGELKSHEASVLYMTIVGKFTLKSLGKVWISGLPRCWVARCGV
jgi:hypothetical protein